MAKQLEAGWATILWVELRHDVGGRKCEAWIEMRESGATVKREHQVLEAANDYRYPASLL
jgi:hypothetical protein